MAPGDRDWVAPRHVLTPEEIAAIREQAEALCTPNGFFWKNGTVLCLLATLDDIETKRAQDAEDAWKYRDLCK